MLLLLLMATAQADVVIPDLGPASPPPEKLLRIQGLDAYPDHVLVVHGGQPGQALLAHTEFTSAGAEEQVVATGDLGATDSLAVYALTRAQHEAWKAQAAAAQQASCASAEGGCTPLTLAFASYPVPRGLPCGYKLDAQEPAAVGPGRVSWVARVTELSDTACRLTPPTRRPADAGEPRSTPPKPSAEPASGAGCAQLPGTAGPSALLLLAMVLGFSRRRQR